MRGDLPAGVHNPPPANPVIVDYGQFFQTSLILGPGSPVDPNPPTPPDPPPPPSPEITAWAAAIAAEVDGRLAGKVPSELTRQVFSAKNMATPAITRNATLWGADWAQQLTGVCMGDKAGGQAWSEQFGGAMITRRHFIQCHHAHFSWNHGPYLAGGTSGVWVLRFVSADGTVHDRTLVANARVAAWNPSLGLGQPLPGRAWDLSVGLLDAPLPEGVHVFRIFPVLTDGQYSALQRLAMPDLSVSQGPGILRPDKWQNAAGTLPLTQEHLLYPGQAFQSFAARPPGERAEWWHPPFDGDSGTPRFLPMPGGELLLSAITSGATLGPALADITTTIGMVDADAVSRGKIATPTGLSFEVAPITVPA